MKVWTSMTRQTDGFTTMQQWPVSSVTKLGPRIWKVTNRFYQSELNQKQKKEIKWALLLEKLRLDFRNDDSPCFFLCHFWIEIGKSKRTKYDRVGLISSLGPLAQYSHYFISSYGKFCASFWKSLNIWTICVPKTMGNFFIFHNEMPVDKFHS